MALHAFGPAIDVHAGGGDLRFPHHAYQAALAETFTGVTPFARTRMNVGVVRVAGAKMAKSSGNLVLAGDLLKDYPAAAIRLLILDRPWDADWDYDRAGLDAAAARLERLQEAAGRPERGAAGSAAGARAGSPALDAVHEALARDLDVPAALRDRGGQRGAGRPGPRQPARPLVAPHCSPSCRARTGYGMMAGMPGEYRLYQELADWWPLISPPGEYAAEAAYLAGLFTSAAIEVRDVLDLGSGGGNVAVHLKDRLNLTLVDLSAGMLAVSSGSTPSARTVRETCARSGWAGCSTPSWYMTRWTT